MNELIALSLVHYTVDERSLRSRVEMFLSMCFLVIDISRLDAECLEICKIDEKKRIGNTFVSKETRTQKKCSNSTPHFFVNTFKTLRSKFLKGSKGFFC